MTHLPLLSILVFLPLAASVLVLALPAAVARAVAIGASVATLLLAILLWLRFVPAAGGFQFEDRTAWLPGSGIGYHVGLDGVSLALVLLVCALAPLALIAGPVGPAGRDKPFAVVVLGFETALLGIFASLDFLLFYVFYEFVLIPSSLLVGIWGRAGAARAAIRFFLFTFTGSLVMLVALIAMWNVAGTTDLPVLMSTSFSPTMQAWLFWAFVAAFGVKLPIWPLHTWLPDAYATAPGAGLILFAGALGKAGGYGFLRFAIQMLPDASAHYAPLMIASGVIAISYGAIVAFAQTDMRRMVAYSSFSHMGIVLVGLFTLTAEGIDGAVFQMLAHGIIIAALFFALSALEARTGSVEIADYAGAARKMPVMAALMMLFTMASLGLPGTGGFVGELLVVIGAIHVGPITALLSAAAMVLGVVYMLALYRGLMFGAVAGVIRGVIPDLGARELAVLCPLALLTLWMGIYPTSFTRLFDAGVTRFAVTHLPTERFTAAPARVPVALAAR